MVHPRQLLSLVATTAGAFQAAQSDSHRQSQQQQYDLAPSLPGSQSEHCVPVFKARLSEGVGREPPLWLALDQQEEALACATGTGGCNGFVVSVTVPASASALPPTVTEPEPEVRELGWGFELTSEGEGKGISMTTWGFGQ